MSSTSLGEPLLRELGDLVTAERAVFCCGGTIRIASGSNCIYKHISADAEPLASPPVDIRWDMGKMTLPDVQGAEGTPAISELLKGCSPATFGHNGQEVLDASYRQAAKLDSHQFCTSFTPHDFGIIDAVAQTLLPEIANPPSTARDEFKEHWGVVAELYKLNVSQCCLPIKRS